MLYNVVDGDDTQKFLKINNNLLKLVPQQFTCNAGLTITLDNSFRREEDSTQTFCAFMDRPFVLFTALKEPFVTFSSLGIDKNSSLEDYAQIIFRANKFENTILQYDEQNNLHYFDNEKMISGRMMHYWCIILKGSDAFWLCQFACESNNFNDFKPFFIDCAKSITII